MVLGCVATGLDASDPARRPQLLAETESHDWYQFNTGSGMQDADPLMPGATIGQTFAASTGTFTDVPDYPRGDDRIPVRRRDRQRPAALRSGLDHVDGARPDFQRRSSSWAGTVTVGNFVTSSSSGGLIFTTATNTYSLTSSSTGGLNPDPTRMR